MKTPLLTLTAIAVVLASPALALEKPMPGKSDSRVRFVDYNASDVVDLWTTPGAILTIEFAADETIAGVAVSDSHVLHSDKRKNFLIQPATHRRAICATSLRTRWDRPQTSITR